MTLSSSPHTTQMVPHSFAALLDHTYDRPEFLKSLKTLMTAAHERIRQEHNAGARGRNVVRHLTALVDDVVRTVFQYVRAQHPEETELCALVALGGYGRGELNPFSDIDLMFLCQKSPPDQVVRDTLYLLWDVGYTLGHSVRTQRDVVKMADTDLTAQTAMLEVRLLDGDRALFEWFHEEIGHRRFTPRRRHAFVRQKIAEYRKRHATFANTVNLMEPNVKESPGGLRDYHTALWISTAFYQTNTLAGLVDAGLLTVNDQEAVEHALDFLFRVRNALHYRHGRKNDLLSVDVQEPLAAVLGFQPSPHKLAVEHFLNTYYMHANVLFNLCLTLVDAVTHMYQPRLWRFLRRSRRIGDGFMIVDGYLQHEASRLDSHLQEHPLQLLQAFAKAQEHHIRLAPTLSRSLKAQGALLRQEIMRHAPEAAAVFFRILSQPQATPILREMHRHGILGAYIPEFDALTCLAQHDLYHRYTVDEHTLRSIEVLESLPETQDAFLKPLARLYDETSDKALLKFALLLHDLGKDAGPGHASHVYRSGELAEIVCERLALPAEQRAVIQLLTVNHLVMNHIAQRRDITDEKVVAEFAEIVKNVANLEQLYLLTYADTSAVGPDVWNTWKGTLLADLYRRTRDYLLQQCSALAPSLAKLREQLRPTVLASLPSHYSMEDVDRFLDSMPARYLSATSAEQLATHITMTQPQLRGPVVLHSEQNFSGGFTNVTICVTGRRGVFSMIAGALSRNKLNILGAQIYTSCAGIAVDTLQVETLEKTPVTDHRVWKQVEADLSAALEGGQSFDTVLTQRRYAAQERKLQAFARPPQVLIDNNESDSYTLVEVQAQDQLGLLYKLTRLLFECGLDVALAKISTEANRAIDVFYVTDTLGKKVTDESAVVRLRSNLLEALL
ncbi:MAG: [protein-PII] uridylyltransferase [Candidatus Tectimicrobiota bacterium]